MLRGIMALRLALPLALVALVLSGPASSQPTLEREHILQVQRDCASIDQCIAAMRTKTAVNFSAILEQKFATFGEAAVEPLMRVLTDDPDPRMRSYAGMALSRMPRIDARFLPALIAESREGDPQHYLDTGPAWLAIPIGLVRDNPDALRHLFDIAEPYGARAHSNAVQPAIERSSRAVWLQEARRRIEAFAPQQSAEYLNFLCQLIFWGGWPRPNPDATPAWLEPALVRVATNPAMNAHARAAAETQLRAFRNPIALAALLRDARVQFAAIPAWDGRSRFVQVEDQEGQAQWERLTDGDIEGTILEIGRFGQAARDAAPLIRSFLARPDLPDSRAQAARALGEIGDRAAIPQLVMALQDRDDWLLVYNSAEALGLLRAEEAREALRDAADRHWSQAVRNNAERALNMIDGGDFERPGIVGDGRGINEGLAEDDELYVGPLRFRGDDAAEQADCLWDAEERGRGLSQSPIGALQFPRRGARGIAPRGVPRTDILRLSESNRVELPRGGRVTAIEVLPRGSLIGTNAGEFIGGLAYVDDSNRTATLVVPDNIALLFRHGGKLYALTGLSHLFSSYGEVWEVDDTLNVPRAVRRIRLPLEASEVYATARHDIAFATAAGTFLLGEGGILRHGEDQSTCGAP